MTDSSSDDSLRDRIQKQGEEALGKVVADLLENPMFTGALARALGARERANEAQQAAMGALNIPTSADLSRLTRRVRSVGQRMEGVEDALDRLERMLGGDGLGSIEDRLSRIEDAITSLGGDAPGAKPAKARKAPSAKSKTASAAKAPPKKKK